MKFNLEPFSWESKSFFDSGILCVGLWGAAWFQRSIIWQTDFPPRNSKTSNNPRPKRALWPQLWKNILGGNYFKLTQKVNFMFRKQNMFQAQFLSLTLTLPVGLPPHAPDAQKIADQRWLIANSAKNRLLFYIKWCDWRLVIVNKDIFSLQSHSVG